MKFKKIINNGSGQAALEFLTTYGWAFLVILIMIGALAYFGILKPSKILPNRCNIGPEFQCIDYQIAVSGTPGNTFKMKLRNNVGEPITVDTISLGSEGTTQYACTLTSPVLPFTWKSGDIQDFSWGTCNSAAAGMIAGEKGKVLLKMVFFSVTSGSTYKKEVSGEVFSTVI